MLHNFLLVLNLVPVLQRLILGVSLHFKCFLGQVEEVMLYFSVTLPLLQFSLVKVSKLDQVFFLHIFAKEVTQPEDLSSVSVN